jgi:two-component system, LuxR family, response regulator FixJ
MTEVLPISTNDRRQARMSPVSHTITIIDDDTAVLDSTRFLLEVYDFEVLTYCSGLDFLADGPDIAYIACLIVDYQMPGMNGLEFLTELRKRGNEVPAIMMSASVSPTLQRQAAELGIKWLLEKPLSNQALLRAIKEELQQS